MRTKIFPSQVHDLVAEPVLHISSSRPELPTIESLVDYIPRMSAKWEFIAVKLGVKELKEELATTQQSCDSKCLHMPAVCGGMGGKGMEYELVVSDRGSQEP